MGLLDFAKDIGSSIFTSEEEAGQKIIEHINVQNPGIQNLQVTVTDGVASISGAARDRAAAEKAILMIGNVRGVKQVNFDIEQLTSAHAPTAKQKAVTEEAAAEAQLETTSNESTAASQIEVEFYEIQSGDSLSAIAKKFYGDANRYNDIFEANKEVIGHPDKIYPGQKIRIPQDGGF